MNEYRQLRERQNSLEGAIDRIGPPGGGTARRLVQVVNQGAMPTTNDNYFACNPVDVGGPEVEGGVPTFLADTTRTLLVDVIGTQVPAVGDYLIAAAVGGRWVAERGSGGPCKCPCVCPDGSMPGGFNLTLSGNGQTYGPILLIPGVIPGWDQPCGYLGHILVDIPATSACAAVTGVGIVAYVYYIPPPNEHSAGFWQLAVFVGGTNTPDAPPTGCLESTFPVGCITGGGLPSAFLTNPIVSGNAVSWLLGACPSLPFTFATTQFVAAVDWLQTFGVSCDGPPPNNNPGLNVTATLTGIGGAPPTESGGTMCQTFHVSPCAICIPGPWTVSVYSSEGGTLLASGTTNASNSVYLSWNGSPTTYWVTATATNYVPVAQSFALASCSGTTNLIPGFVFPVDPGSATITDSVLFPGGLPATWTNDVSSLVPSYSGGGSIGHLPSGTGGFFAQSTYTYPTCPPPNGPGGGTFTFLYVLFCSGNGPGSFIMLVGDADGNNWQIALDSVTGGTNSCSPLLIVENVASSVYVLDCTPFAIDDSTITWSA